MIDAMHREGLRREGCSASGKTRVESDLVLTSSVECICPDDSPTRRAASFPTTVLPDREAIHPVDVLPDGSPSRRAASLSTNVLPDRGAIYLAQGGLTGASRSGGCFRPLDRNPGPACLKPALRRVEFACRHSARDPMDAAHCPAVRDQQ